MLEIESKPGKPASSAVMSSCPQCESELVVLSVIGGRAEYWAMQCTGCGGIHLDIVNPAPLPHSA